MNTSTEHYVGEIMTRNVFSVRENASLTDAIRILEQDSLSALPVVNEAGKVCGILSLSDLIALTYSVQSDVAILPFVGPAARETLIEAFSQDNLDTDVSSVMTCHVKSVKPQDEIAATARLMTENSIHHVPVVNKLGEPVGILSASDFVRAVAYKSYDQTDDLRARPD